MAAAPGIVTSGTGPPNAVVQIQPGMNVQPVVLVDANGQYLATSGSAATAGYLADASGSVAVFAAAAPVTGQVLTATSGTTATWQTGVAGSAATAGSATTAAAANALNSATTTVSVSGATAPSAGQVLTASSGSAATWSFGLTSVMSALGDTIYENATPAPARLAGNATAQKMFLSQTGSGTASAAPAWSVVSGQYLCTPTQYAPGTRATFTTASGTMAAVSSANINTGTFTAPASGDVVVATGLVVSITTTGNHLAFGLAAHNTVSPMVSNEWIFAAPTASPLPYAMQFIVTGLTAGSAYSFDLMYSSPDGGTISVLSQGATSTAPGNTSGGPTTMTVQAV